MQAIEMWLVHPEENACSAFAVRFNSLPNVHIHQCRFEELPPHDCFVTAGNSYGLMTAGIDASVVHFFGKVVMERVQHRILNEYLGEQPIGTAFIVVTDHPDRPFVCHAPTMRTPGSIEGTDKIYVSTWASLLAVYNYNVILDRPIRSVAFPAMGTGFGGVSYDECARQMAAAYHHFINLPHRSLDWDWVTSRQKRICYDGKRQVCR
ncbi:MAG: macro domain-containing protein [bacterium]|nr:macro domain-containing protein [bacterium]